MPREIYINPAVSSIDEAIVPARRLGEARAGTHLLYKARRRASSMIRKAREEADNCRQLGFVQGYRDGFLMLAMNLVEHMDGRSEFLARVEHEVFDNLKERLSDTLACPPVLLACIDEWQQREMPDREAPVRLVLPRDASAPGSLLMARLQGTKGRRVSIEYHDERGFILEAGNEVVRLDPDRIAAAISGDLRRSLLRETLPRYLDSTINDAIENLWYLLQERYPLGMKGTSSEYTDSDEHAADSDGE